MLLRPWFEPTASRSADGGGLETLDGQSLCPPKYFEASFKKKLFYCFGRGVKSKTLVLSADLNNSSWHRWKTVDRKADGHFEWKPFVSSNQGRFIKWLSSATGEYTGKWEKKSNHWKRVTPTRGWGRGYSQNFRILGTSKTNILFKTQTWKMRLSSREK